MRSMTGYGRATAAFEGRTLTVQVSSVNRRSLDLTVALPDGTEAKGVANVGRRPTLGGDPETRLETYIFDWSGDIYGQEIGVRLIRFFRPDAKFDGLEQL